MKTKKLNPFTTNRWSGGGANLFSNVIVATEEFPEHFSSNGTPVFFKNVVPLKHLIQGDFICVPQNAWPWFGTTKSMKEFVRRSLLRVASEITFLRAKRIIRIGPMIISSEKKSYGYLPNVLDSEFEEAIDKSSTSIPQWLPDNHFFFTPGSFWSYRNLESVIDAYIEYHSTESDPIPMLIVGPAVQKKYFDRLVKRAVNCAGIKLIGEKVDRAHVLHAMSASRLTVFPSMVEASPVTLLECAAMESPCVVSDIPAHHYMEEFLGGTKLKFFSNSDQLVTIFRTPPEKQKSKLSDSKYRSKLRQDWAQSFIEFCLREK